MVLLGMPSARPRITRQRCEIPGEIKAQPHPPARPARTAASDCGKCLAKQSSVRRDSSVALLPRTCRNCSRASLKKPVLSYRCRSCARETGPGPASGFSCPSQRGVLRPDRAEEEPNGVERTGKASRCQRERAPGSKLSKPSSLFRGAGRSADATSSPGSRTRRRFSGLRGLMVC